MNTVEEPLDIAERIPSKCTRCQCALMLEVGAGCPPIRVEAWMRIVVCNRCGKYLERYRQLDDAIAFVCSRWSMAGKNRDAARSQIFAQLEALTLSLVRLFCERWQTTAEWHPEFVDLLLDLPDRSRIAVRMEEATHKKARAEADRQIEFPR